jgi:hypothetical protein
VTVLRDNIGLNDRQAKFVSLVAAGELSVVECYRRAGFAGDTSNANKLKKHLADFIEEERAKLGLRPIGEEEPGEVDNAAVAEILKLQRKLYADAVEAGNLPIQRAALREIAKLLKPKRPPGRPTLAKPASAPRENMFAHMSPDEFTALVDSILELPEIEG